MQLWFHRWKVLIVLMAVPLVASGCGKLGGGGRKTSNERLSGERIAVLDFEQELSVDPTISDVEVRLPRPYANDDWPQVGGHTSHALHHLAIGDNLSRVWDASIGAGSSGDRRLTTTPVIGDGRIYSIDTEASVSAIDARSGRRQWSVRLEDEEERRNVAFGGGVAYDNGVVYATTGYGFAAALNATNGGEIWRADLGIPLRGAPTVADGRVFVITYDNQLYALDAESGAVLWYHVGIAEDQGMMGMASPAVSGQLVVAAFSSGELVALRVENGNVAWTDSLTRTGRMTPLATINDIDGLPVIDRGNVFAISHSGRMVSINMRTGEREWEANIGGIQTPWVAGDFIFLVTVDSEVVCLERTTGRVRWIQTLQRFAGEKKKKGLVIWNGPVLAGDRLILTSSHGYAVSVSPYTGDILGAIKLPAASFVSPIVADQTLYQLIDSGRIVAMR